MDEWHFIADRKIREAMQEGAFDDLDGTGQPLHLEEDPFVDPSLQMAHRLLKNAGLAPEWILDSRDIDLEVRRLHAEAAAPRADYAERIAALNQRILAFNLKAPSVTVHKRPFPTAG